MSENTTESENETRFFLGDQEYILGQDGIAPEFKDLFSNDTPRAILVNGQYILTESNTIFLQDSDTSNLTEFYINDNSESFVIDEDNSVNNLFQNAECVQLVGECTNDMSQIIYYTNDEGHAEVARVTEVNDDIEGIQDEDGNIYPFKRIKLDKDMNLEDLQKEGLAKTEGSEGNSVQYAILEKTIDENKVNESLEKSKENEIVDLSKITGRNLITGQTVTLHSYMEKIKNRLSKSSKSRKSSKKFYNDDIRKPEFTDLIDKKISIGKTRSGKKIVGKIIHVDIKNDSDKDNELLIEDHHGENTEDREVDEETPEITITEPEPTNRVLIKKSVISKESFEQITKTLSGVMEMESVRKKLESKNIVVKLVERKYVAECDSYVKSIAHTYGYMEQGVEGDEEKWKFVHDQDTQDILLGSEDKKSAKFTITTSLTILITHEKGGGKTVRVNLNPAPGNVCSICAQYFKTNLQLRQHMNQVHNTYGNNSTCEICNEFCADSNTLQEHRIRHTNEGKLFTCEDCGKKFKSEAKLEKHRLLHDVYLRPLECSVCEVRCSSEWALKRHLMTHTGLKPFECDLCNRQFMTQYDVNFHKKTHFPDKHFACNICFRTFSRQSNLARHLEIHKGTGALYKCDICYCSFNYVSSLTRHVVQNHVGAEKLKE